MGLFEKFKEIFRFRNRKFAHMVFTIINGRTALNGLLVLDKRADTDDPFSFVGPAAV